MTELYKADNIEEFSKALELIQSGEVIALPTETVYGLAADVKKPEAIKKIFKAKNRPPNHPLIVHIHDVDDLFFWAEKIPLTAFVLAKAFWPGPLTLILKKSNQVSSIITGGLDSVALRVPSHPVFLKVLKTLGTALAAPSANIHKKISPTTAQQVVESLYGKIPAVLDGGPCLFGLESTILDLTGKVPRILRPGPITKKMLEKTLRQDVLSLKMHQESVPGNMSEHYQPQTPLYIVNSEDLKKTLCEKNSKIVLLHISPLDFDSADIVSIKMPSNNILYARNLYKRLFELDKLSLKKIVVEEPPGDSSWDHIRDRLSKASFKSI